MTDDFESVLQETKEKYYARLGGMTREQRLEYFRKQFLEDFTLEDADTTYIVRTHFSSKAAESLQEKAEKFVAKK